MSTYITGQKDGTGKILTSHGNQGCICFKNKQTNIKNSNIVKYN